MAKDMYEFDLKNLRDAQRRLMETPRWRVFKRAGIREGIRMWRRLAIRDGKNYLRELEKKWC